jgi:hypothetical protein
MCAALSDSKVVPSSVANAAAIEAFPCGDSKVLFCYSGALYSDYSNGIDMGVLAEVQQEGSIRPEKCLVWKSTASRFGTIY